MHNYRDGDIDLPMTLTNDHSKAMWGAENGSPLKKVVFDKPNLSKRKGGHKKGEQETLRFSLQHIKTNNLHIEGSHNILNPQRSVANSDWSHYWYYMNKYHNDPKTIAITNWIGSQHEPANRFERGGGSKQNY